MHSEWIAIEIGGKVNLLNIRKMLKVILYDTKTQIILYSQNKTKPKRERQIYAMVVENSAEEYVNTLNEIKQSFKQENIDKGIIGMRSTKEGILLITFEKNEDLKNKISSTLVNEKSNGKRIRLLNDEKRETIYIRGMDATAKKEEVLEALDLYVENFYRKTYRL